MSRSPPSRAPDPRDRPRRHRPAADPRLGAHDSHGLLLAGPGRSSRPLSHWGSRGGSCACSSDPRSSGERATAARWRSTSGSRGDLALSRRPVAAVRPRLLLAGLGAARVRHRRGHPRGDCLFATRVRSKPPDRGARDDARRRGRRAGDGAAADRARPARRRPGAPRRTRHEHRDGRGEARHAIRRPPGSCSPRRGPARGEALEELRDLARGIHPPILTDRGLEAAIRALVARTPLRVDVSVDLDERPRPPVETAAYFVVAEALANAGKYSGAEHVAIGVHVTTAPLSPR